MSWQESTGSLALHNNDCTFLPYPHTPTIPTPYIQLLYHCTIDCGNLKHTIPVVIACCNFNFSLQ